jgi:moderate conductance mechanosensitive channel
MPLTVLVVMVVAVVALFSLTTPGSAQVPLGAQPTTTVDEPVIDPEALERVIRTLADEPARERLLEELRALQAAQLRAEEPDDVGLAGHVLQSLSNQFDLLGTSLGEAASGFADLPEFSLHTAAQLGEPDQRRHFFAQVATVLAAVLIGLVAYAVVVTTLRRVRGAMESRRAHSLPARLGLLSVKLVLDLLAAGAFLVAAMAVLSLIDPPRATRIAGLALINATAMTLAVLAFSNFVLAPRAPGLRLIRLRDETAHYLQLWVRRLAVVAVYGLMLADAARLIGAPAAAHEMGVRLIGLLLGLMGTVLVLQNRREVSRRLSRSRTTREGRRGLLANLSYRIADVWHVLAIAAIVVLFVMWFVSPADGGRSLAMGVAFAIFVMIVARLAEHVFDQLVVRGFRVAPDLAQRFPGFEQRANRYVSLIRWTGSIIIWTVALIVILAGWGLDSVGWITAGTGREVVGSLITIAVIIAIAALVWEFTSSAIARYLASQDANGATVERSARIRTLLPLLRNAFLVFLIGVVGLTVLAELGINIAPLLAGAGIIGLAIGFGSQTLVRDIITGLFILIEDTISVGEVVTVGSHTGVVEAMSIRAVRLRDLSGSVHTVPWSEVTSVVNLTKDFSFYVMNIGIAYREDVDSVIEVIKKVGGELQADPTYGREILQPLEVLGVDSFGDNAVVIKARIKTYPIKQWFVGREFNRRMKRRFDELGIQIPFPHRTVYFGEDKTGSAPPARVIVGPGESGPGESGKSAPAAGAGKAAPKRAAARAKG